RHGRAHCRSQIPRRVRRAPEGRPEGTAHRGRSREGRRRHGRRQPAEAHAGSRRTASHRRHHTGRIPQVHREGCCPRAPLPARGCRPAQRRGHHLDPARLEGALRSPPRRADQGFRARGRGYALQSLHHGPVPARQSHRSGRRGGRPPEDRDRLDAVRA
ncbi:hypothetical protein OY671_010727, partial [Metschnikowia pulcherrima]